MLPTISGTPLPDAPWRDFSFDTVLGYYDGPRLLLQLGKSGELYLALWNDDDEAVERWVCIPVGLAGLRAILSGQVNLRHAIDYPENGQLLVVDLDLATDAVIRLVGTNSTALPRESLPMPQATFTLPDSAIEKIIGDLPPAVPPALADTPHPYRGPIAIPIRGIVNLHEGIVGACHVMADQVQALESEGIKVMMGANGPPAGAINAIVGAAPIFQQLGAFVETLASPSTAANDSSLYKFAATTREVSVPYAQVVQLSLGVRSAGKTVSELFDELQRHELSDRIGEDHFSNLDALARAEYIVNALDAASEPRTGGSPYVGSPELQNDGRADDASTTFREIGAYLRNNNLTDLVSSLSR